MITPYINQIQKIFMQTVRHYKSNTAGQKDLDPKVLDNLEKLAETKFSKDLKDFLKWSCVMPIWRAPFFAFDDSSDKFEVWSNKAEIVEIYLTNERFSVHRFEVMHGRKVSGGGEDHIFKVCVDVHKKYTGNSEGVFIVYGKKKEGYSDFESEDETEIFTISDDIKGFIVKYLEFLKTVPIKKKNFPKIDKLFNDPKKLFDFVKSYNWDNGDEEMEYIISSDKCDDATALLVYWLSSPYSFDESGEEFDMLPFVVEKNFQKDFYVSSSNSFDPSENELADFVDEYESAKNRDRDLPKFMLEKKV